MAVDQYSQCPGGTGKKIKFCCPDLVTDLGKINKMFEGQQYQACSQALDRLLDQHPDRACLLATKTLLLRILDHTEEANRMAAVFLEKHPENPTALSEAAITAASEKDGRQAMEPLQQALSQSDNQIPSRVLLAMRSVAQRCLVDGHFSAARALVYCLATLNRDDEELREQLGQLARAHEVPPLIRGEQALSPFPDGVPSKERFSEALSLANRARWAEAATIFEQLSEEAPASPPVWWNLALLRAWLADREGAIEALEKYASLDVPLEDAVEALATARLLSDNPFGDLHELFALGYAVGDVEHVQAALASSQRIEQIEADLSRLVEEAEAPPKAAFSILDRRQLKSVDELSLDTVPRTIGRAVLYGRQTDRDARLDVLDVDAGALDEVKSLLASLAGSELTEEVVDRVGHESATDDLLTRRWRLPPGSSREHLEDLSRRYFEQALLETWPSLPLGLFDGRSAREVAGEETYRVKVLAAILVIESWTERSGVPFDFNRLRARLELPTLEPIDPDETAVTGLPLVRLHRVAPEKLDQETLVACFRRAMFYEADSAVKRFAREIADRPSMEGSTDQLEALAVLPRVEEDHEQALKDLQRGREAGKAHGMSCASWDLMEVGIRLRRREGPEVSQLLQHLRQAHWREPGVAESVTHLLMQIGAIEPDGSLRIPAQRPEPEEPSIVVPGQEKGEAGKLWTPDAAEGAAKASKLWTPGGG